MEKLPEPNLLNLQTSATDGCQDSTEIVAIPYIATIFHTYRQLYQLALRYILPSLNL